ncbi:GolD/DthD family dehydrogenase [Lichenifustis flavocetrariae]|uniref:D-threitol dehydrogenase n=1 Tax=Lichenifustis flavocetrariae TaxID=2949735 RepID=A0AA42CKE1_9HYPH|nr:D-threitol dehydrogenase [Lichenifustis flavocetrariae]MCW6510444.1 D-threitol dehydrogenase [Lichenifustis flavocetrariae]
MDRFDFDTAFSLRNQTALVTGGAAGIGAAIATALAARGARVALVDRDPAVMKAAQALGEGHVGIEIDVTADNAPQQVVDQVVAQFGQLDILINNAGIVRLAPAEEATRVDWDLTLAVNLTAPFLFAQAAGRHMIGRRTGRIVNLASQAATVALQSHVAYCTSKAAIVGMTKVMALEWGPHGITTNSISPTVVETELGKKAWAGEVGEAMKKLIPSRRFAQPEEIALAVLYLASPAAAMVNGADLAIDGGYTIQ